MKRRYILGIIAVWVAAGGIALGLALSSTATGIATTSNFDSNTIQATFANHQCADNTPNINYRYRGTYALTASPGGVTGKSLTITVPTPPAGSWRLASCAMDGIKEPMALGTNEAIGISVWIPNGFTIPNSSPFGVNMYEMHTQFVVSAPVLLELHANSISLVTQTGPCTPANHGPGGGCQFHTSNQYAIPVGSLVPNAWNDVIVSAHWASDSSGTLDTYYRVRGGTWSHSAHLSGQPSVQWKSGSSPGGTVQSNLQVYTSNVTRPLSVTFDNAVTGSSLTAVENAIP